MNKLISNNKGMSTILIVMAISMIILTTLGSAQMYIESRARIHARIRIAYKYTFVMEDAAKTLVNARLARIDSGANNCASLGIALRTLTAGPEICLSNTLTGVVPNQTSPRCILDSAGRAACICMDALDNATCADRTQAFMNEHLLKKGDQEQTLVAKLKNFIDQKKYVVQDTVAAGVEKIFSVPEISKPKMYDLLFGERAVAATIAITMRGVDKAALTHATAPWAPPSTANQALTTFDCAAGECYTVRVCINSDTEPLVVPTIAAGGTGFLCMEQRIARVTGDTQF